MSLNGICQRCGCAESDWTVNQAEFNVGRVKHWKVQLCKSCTESVEQALLAALRRVGEPGGTPT